MLSTTSVLRAVGGWTLATGLALACLPVLAQLAGCSGSNAFGAFDPRAQAMAALSDEIKNAVKQYLSGLNGVVDSVAQAKDFSSALDAAKQFEPYYKELKAALPVLQQLEAKDLENVRTAFGPELDAARSDLEAQIERVSGSSTIGSVLKPLLERIATFS
jgi:hypothetical protein